MTDNQVTYKLGRQVIKLLINSQPLYSDRYCLDRFNVVTDCHLSVVEENLVSFSRHFHRKPETYHKDSSVIRAVFGQGCYAEVFSAVGKFLNHLMQIIWLLVDDIVSSSEFILPE